MASQADLTEAGIARQAEKAIREFQQSKAKFIEELHSLLLPVKNTTHVPIVQLLNNDVVSLLTCPLINDPQNGIQSASLQASPQTIGIPRDLSAMVPRCNTHPYTPQCLAAITKATDGVGHALCKSGAVSTVLAALDHPNKHVQVDANILLQAVAKESSACVHELVDLRVLEGLRPQLESLDRDIQRSAAETLEAGAWECSCRRRRRAPVR